MNKEYVTTYWNKIKVGDIIRIRNNDFIPVRKFEIFFLQNFIGDFKADMILISTSEANGLGLIETADLDG